MHTQLSQLAPLPEVPSEESAVASINASPQDTSVSESRHATSPEAPPLPSVRSSQLPGLSDVVQDTPTVPVAWQTPVASLAATDTATTATASWSHRVSSVPQRCPAASQSMRVIPMGASECRTGAGHSSAKN